MTDDHSKLQSVGIREQGKRQIMHLMVNKLAIHETTRVSNPCIFVLHSAPCRFCSFKSSFCSFCECTALRYRPVFMEFVDFISQLDAELGLFDFWEVSLVTFTNRYVIIFFYIIKHVLLPSWGKMG